jgi:hypothetical protein
MSELCEILGTSTVPTQEHLKNLIESLFELLCYIANMLSRMHNKFQYTYKDSISHDMALMDLLQLFKEIVPYVNEVYYGGTVDDAMASEIVNATWKLACTCDKIVSLFPSTTYSPRQAVEIACAALFHVEPIQEEDDEEDEDTGPLKRLPAAPYDYVGIAIKELVNLRRHYA